MKYFTLQECFRSETARKRGLDNTPDAACAAHLAESVEQLLDPLREAWESLCRAKALGSPCIRISSGYRGAALNRAVGGSATSAHRHGYAFDLIPHNGRMMEFKNFCRDFLRDRDFDQLISEGEDEHGRPRWMHVGYKSPGGEQRRQFLSMRNGRYLAMTR